MLLAVDVRVFLMMFHIQTRKLKFGSEARDAFSISSMYSKSLRWSIVESCVHVGRLWVCHVFVEIKDVRYVLRCAMLMVVFVWQSGFRALLISPTQNGRLTEKEKLEGHEFYLITQTRGLKIL